MADIGDILQFDGVNTLIFKFTQKSTPNVNIKLASKMFYEASKHMKHHVTFKSPSDISQMFRFKNHKRIFVNVNFVVEDDSVLMDIFNNKSVYGFGINIGNGHGLFYNYMSYTFEKITTLRLTFVGWSGSIIDFLGKFENVNYIMFMANGSRNVHVELTHGIYSQFKKVYTNNIYLCPCGDKRFPNIKNMICDYTMYNHAFGVRNTPNTCDIYYAKIRYMRVNDDFNVKNIIIHALSIIFEYTTLNWVENLTILPAYGIIHSCIKEIYTPNLKSLTLCDYFNTKFVTDQPLLCLNIICCDGFIHVNKIKSMLEFYKPKATRIIVKYIKWCPGDDFKKLCKEYNVCLTVNNWNSNWHIPDD